MSLAVRCGMLSYRFARCTIAAYVTLSKAFSQLFGPGLWGHVCFTIKSHLQNIQWYCRCTFRDAFGALLQQNL